MELIITVIGVIGSLLGIYEFLFNRLRPQELPAVSVAVTPLSKRIVVNLKKEDREDSESLAYQVYKFVDEYKPSKEMEPYFIYNPNGHYSVSRLKLLMGMLLGSSFMFILPGSIYAISKFSGVEPNNMAIIIPMFFLLGVVGFYFARRAYVETGVIKRYIEFLHKNKLFVGLQMSQEIES